MLSKHHPILKTFSARILAINHLSLKSCKLTGNRAAIKWLRCTAAWSDSPSEQDCELKIRERTYSSGKTTKTYKTVHTNWMNRFLLPNDHSFRPGLAVSYTGVGEFVSSLFDSELLVIDGSTDFESDPH